MNAAESSLPQPSLHPFICPECGGREERDRVLVSPAENPFSPWAHVLETVQCAKCRRHIPAHLGERWNGMTLRAARAEWRSEFRQRTKRVPSPPTQT